LRVLKIKYDFFEMEYEYLEMKDEFLQIKYDYLQIESFLGEIYRGFLEIR